MVTRRRGRKPKAIRKPHDGRPEDKPLRPREVRFVQEYLAHFVGTRAAIAIGASPKSARTTASRLLSHANIAKAIREGREKQAEKLEITAERVARELALMGFANMADYIVPDENGGDRFVGFGSLNRDQAAAIAEVTIEKPDLIPGKKGQKAKVLPGKVRFKLDKRGALVDLGTHLGMFKQTVQIGSDPKNPVRFIIDGLEIVAK